MTTGIEEGDDAVVPRVEDIARVGPTERRRSGRSRLARNGAASGDDSADSEQSDHKSLEPVDRSEYPTASGANDDEMGPTSSSTSSRRDRGDSTSKAGPRARPKTLMELIEAAYGTTSKFALTAADFDVLQGSITADQPLIAERARTLELASYDNSLRGLVNFLSPIAQHASTKSLLRDRVSELALAALAQHPLFIRLLSNSRTSGGLPDVPAKRVWFLAPNFVQGLGKGETQSKVLRANAVVVFVLLRVIRDGWTLEELEHALGETLWASPPEAAARRIASAAILVGAGDYDIPTRLGVLHQRAEVAARDARKRLSDATAESLASFRRAKDAEARAVQLEAKAAALELNLSTTRDELRQTAAQLQTELERGSVARSHHAEDYETLRTQILRQLAKQADLLADGLHALRNGSHGVAEEFVDRALTAISREVASLKEQGDKQ